MTIVHAGSLCNQRNPLPLLEALSELIRSGRVPAGGVALHFVGTVAPEFNVPGVVQRLGLDATVTIVGRVSHQESLTRLASADLLLLIQPGTDLQVPAKLYEYMGLGRPVLALSGPGAVADLVRQARLGPVVAPDDVGAIADVLQGLYEDRGGLAESFDPDPEVVRQFDGRELASRFERVLRTVLANDRPGVNET